MLSDVVDAVVDAFSILVGFSGTIFCMIGLMAGYYIGSQETMSDMQRCQQAAHACTVVTQHGLIDKLVIQPKALRPASAAQ